MSSSRDGRREIGLKRAFLIGMAVCLALAAGCASGASQAPPTTAEPRTDGPDAMPRAASIPTLEFVVTTELPKSADTKPGSSLKEGSYKPAMTGKGITSVQWIVGEAEGLRRMMLSLEFDPDSRQQIESLIMTHTDQNLLVAIEGRVIGSMAVYEPVSETSLTLGSPDIAAARAQIDAATVPSE